MAKMADFSGGRGYIEKDWGHSFPSAYVWMQSNHFQLARISPSRPLWHESPG
ncbi:MAG: tocopherol cyclase family protein [Marinilabiliales bacterium]|nr:tocopherol cyclase family protein [Marinilabiliales bacterium]